MCDVQIATFRLYCITYLAGSHDCYLQVKVQDQIESED